MASERPTRPRIQPVPKVAARAREVAEGGLVRPINLSATLAHNRPVSRAIAAVSSVFFDPAVLDPRLRELVILRTGWATQAVYEFGQHVLAARQVGIDDETIRHTTRPVDEGAWSPLERAALLLVDDLCRDDCVSDAVWADVEAQAGQERAIALVALCGVYRLVAGVLNSLGIQPEDDLPGWPAART